MYTILCKHISKVKVYLNNSEKEKNLDCRYNTLQQGYSTSLEWGPDFVTEIFKGAIHFRLPIPNQIIYCTHKHCKSYTDRYLLLGLNTYIYFVVHRIFALKHSDTVNLCVFSQSVKGSTKMDSMVGFGPRAVS